MKLTKSKLEQLIKEEINKYQLEEYEETVEASDPDFERIRATWNPSIDLDGNPTWKKRHKITSAEVEALDASKWKWVVWKFKHTGNPDDEDFIEDAIAQGIETSSRDAILAADKVLTTGRWEY